MDLTPLIKPESSTWWSFPTLDNSSDQFPMVRWSDLENIFENTLTFCHNFLDVVDPILSFLFLSAWLFKFLFLEVCGKAGPSICELIKSLCEGGGRLFTGLRGRGVRKVLEILNWKGWNFGNFWLRGQYFNQEIPCISSLYLSFRQARSHENRCV